MNTLRTILAMVLATISIGAWAQDRVVIAATQNGTIKAATVAATGQQTVTLTVTPADNYFIEASDIVVSKTSGNALARSNTPGYADKLTVKAASVDERGKGTYQFTLPDGYGAYVEATFTPCIAINPTVSITGWTYGATANKPTVTGNTGNGAVTITYAAKGSSTFTATVPTNAGNYTVKAVIAATGHYLGGEATADFTISKAAGTISYATTSVTKNFGDAPFTNALTMTGDGTVNIASSDTKVATVDATTGLVTIKGTGTATITATVKDGTNYTYATKTAAYKLTVNAAQMTVTAQGYSGTYDGKAHGITVTAPEGATVKYGEASDNCNLSASPTYINAGTYTVYYEVTRANYATVKGSEKVSISKAAGTINYATTSITKNFGDAPFTNKLTLTGDGTVSITSSNVNVATVDGESGLVTIVGTGSTTITAKVTDGTNYTYSTKRVAYTLKVQAGQITATAKGYEGTYDGQPHGITVTVTSPEGAVVKYGESRTACTLDASPTYTNTGTYTVYYEVTKANYTTVKGSEKVVISKAAGTISYATTVVSKTFGDEPFINELTIIGDGTVSYASADTKVASVNASTGEVTVRGNGTTTITATVKDGTNYTYATKTATYTLSVGTAVMTVTAQGYEGTYDGKSHGITVTAPEGASVKYGETEGTYNLYTSPTYTNAGTYTVYYQVTKNNFTPVNGSATVVISKAEATISYATASISKTFGDMPFTNPLTKTGDGTVSYASADEKVATVNATSGLVTITGNGTTTITATVTDGTNYTYATKTATFTLSVGTAAMTVSAQGYNGIYDGKGHGITVTAPADATVKYGETEGNYTLTESPMYVDAGTYTVYYQVTKENYTPVSGSAKVVISKAAGYISFAATTIRKTFGDASFTNALTVTGDGTVSYASADANIATVDAATGEVTIVSAGTTTITATVTDGTNYTYTTKTATFILTVGTAAMTVTAQGYEGTYDGQAHGITVTAPEGATVKYGEMVGSYTLTESPTYTNAGTYTVCYEVTKENFTTVTGSATVVISAKAIEAAMIAAIGEQLYTGSPLTPAITVQDGSAVLEEGTDYTTAYANNTGVGTATVTVTGMGNYSGSAKVTFAIVADKTALKEAIAIATDYYESIKDTWTAIAAKLKDAIDAAQAIADDPNATQETTDAAIKTLQTAVQTAKDDVQVAEAIVTVKVDGNGTATWYDMSGRKLAGQPVKKGMYILNGKTVIIR